MRSKGVKLQPDSTAHSLDQLPQNRGEEARKIHFERDGPRSRKAQSTLLLSLNLLPGPYSRPLSWGALNPRPLLGPPPERAQDVREDGFRAAEELDAPLQNSAGRMQAFSRT